MNQILFIYSKRKFWLIAGVIGILITGLRFTSGLDKILDIRLWDETSYLYSGVNFFRMKANPGWGPLYSLWYFVLSLFSKDTVDLYYTNYKLTTIFPCILFFIFLYKLKIAPAISFYLSTAFLFSIFNLPVWPRVSHFCISIILAGLILIIFVKDKDRKIITAVLLSLICSYIRPEFLISFILLIFFSTYRVLRNRTLIKDYLLVILLSISTIIILGSPYSADRNSVAFSQAFDKDITVSERINSNVSQGRGQIIKKDFGNSNSVSGSLINDPKRFFNHLAMNSSRLKPLILDMADSLIPIKIFHFNYLTAILLLLLIPITLIIMLLTDKQKVITGNYLTSLDDNKHLIILAIILTIPSLAEIFIYYPRSHYFVLLHPAFYLLISYMLFPFPIKNVPINGIIILLIFAFSNFLIPSLNNYFIQKNRTNVNIIRKIRDLELKPEVNFLEYEGGYSVYAGNNFKTVEIDEKPGYFPAFLIDKKVNLIYPTNNLANALSPYMGPSYRDFLINFKFYNYNKIIIGDGDYLLIKNELYK